MRRACLFLPLLALLSCARTQSPTTGQPVIDPRHVVDVGNGGDRGYYVVADAYSNVIAAEKKYQDRRVRFEGHITSITRSGDGFRVLLGPGIQGGTDIRSIGVCDFPARAADKLANASGWVAIIGTCRGMINTHAVYFEDCVISPPGKPGN